MSLSSTHFIPPSPVSQFKDAATLTAIDAASADFGGEIVPLTVIPTSNITFGQSEFDSVVSSYTAKDDVFSTSFLAGKSITCSHDILSSLT